MKTSLALALLMLLVAGCARDGERTWALTAVEETSETVRSADGHETARVVIVARIAHSARYLKPLGLKIIVKDPASGVTITDFQQWPSYAVGTRNPLTETTVFVYVPQAELEAHGELEVHALISSEGLGTLPVVRRLQRQVTRVGQVDGTARHSE